jgi:hypothetical protein
MDPITTALIAKGVGALGGLLGGNTDAASQLKWMQNLLSTGLNIGTDAKQFGQDIAMSGKDDLFNQLMPFLNNGGAGNEHLRQLMTGMIGDSMNPESFYNPFNFLGQNPTNAGMNPMMQYGIDQLGQLGSESRGMGEMGAAIFGNGGRTAESGTAFDMIQRLMSQSGNPEMRNIASQVIQGGGANPYSNFTVDAGTNAINRGGATDQSRSLQNFGQQGLQSGGMTPWDQLALQAAQQGLATQGFNQNSNALSAAGQGILASGGNTAANNFLQNRGQDILSKNPLMSMEEATGIAGDKAASQFASNSAQNYRQAMLRGGGPAVRSGLQNQAVQENENEMLRNVGEAQNNARLGQQGLQLQEFGQGAGLMGSGMQDILQRMGLGGSLTQGGEQAALQRMLGLTGLGSDSSNRAINAQQLFAQMMGQSGQLENQNMSILGGLGMQGLGAANDKLGMGINLFGQTNNTEMNAIQQYLANLQGQNQFALGGAQAGQQGFNSGMNAYNNVFGNSLGADQFGLNRLQTQYGAHQANMGQNQNFTNTQQSNWLQGLNPLNNYMTQGFNMYNNAMGGIAGMVGGYRQNPASNSIGNAVTGGIQAGIGIAGQQGNGAGGGQDTRLGGAYGGG